VPASWRTSDLTVLAVAGAGTVLLTAASFVVAPTESFPREDGSSYAAHPDGARAAFLLLKELGHHVERSFEPLAATRHAPEETTIVIASPSQPPSQQDVRALRAFLDRGGVVLATGPMAATFLPNMPNRSDAVRTRPSRARRQEASLPSPLSSGVVDIDMPAATAPLPLDSPYVPVYGSYAEPAVVTARFDKGRAMWWAGSTPLANGSIGRPGHAELFVNALGPAGARTVLWDEFYHGHTRSFWSYVASTPLPVAGLQLAGIVGAALFTYSRRRRPIRPRVIEARTSPLEFIETMGGLYERARAAAAAVATVRTHVRRRLMASAGLPSSATDERLITVASERLALDPAELSTLFSNARTAAEDSELTARQAVPIVAELQELAAKVQAVHVRKL